MDSSTAKLILQFAGVIFAFVGCGFIFLEFVTGPKRKWCFFLGIYSIIPAAIYIAQHCCEVKSLVPSLILVGIWLTISMLNLWRHFAPPFPGD
jgi:uncharacterized membrane protein